jgi:uncharacterized FlgJ-related protein
MIDLNIQRAKDFIEFVDQNDKKSIFLKYMQNYIQRRLSAGEYSMAESSMARGE